MALPCAAAADARQSEAAEFSTCYQVRQLPGGETIVEPVLESLPCRSSNCNQRWMRPVCPTGRQARLANVVFVSVSMVCGCRTSGHRKPPGRCGTFVG